MPHETTDMDGIRRRAFIALVGLPASALALSTTATQFIAWKLNYDRILGPPVIEHAYWPWRAVQWWMAPWEPAVDQTFTMVGFGIGGILGLALMGVLKAQGRKPVKHPTLHGTAHHLTEQEVRATGLLPDPKMPRPGIIVGGWTDRRGHLHYLVHSGADHVLCLGPTRSGKTASLLIPTLLTWPFSLVVYDPKGELWQQSAGWRQREAGNIVMRFAPADVNNTSTLR